MAGEALEQMLHEFEAFLADPESYDRRRRRRGISERIDLVKACIDDIHQLEHERRSLSEGLETIRLVVGAVTGDIVPGLPGAD